ncbi:MAG: molybdopterin-dependent oxidoreductase, partial [Anaerolineae bacterium]
VEIFLALLAKHTRRPVRLVYTREESFIAQSKRHPFTITHRTGVKRSGRITAAQIDMVADAGAYPYLSPYVLLYATIMSTGPYKVDNLQVDSVVAATNQPFTSAMRGFGGPQAAVAYEQQMDEIADALDLDPLEVRRVNYLKSGERNATGQTIDSAAWLEETATHALSALGDKERDSGPMRVGRGLASTFQSYGRITWFHDTAQAWVGVEMDGAVVVRCGVPDHGGGQVNSLAQIAGEVLGVPMDEVTVYSTDSAVTPLAGTTTATRQLYMSGNAVHKAAAAIRKVLLERASKHFEEPVENLDLADSQVFVMDDPSQTEAVEDLVARCASEGLPLSNLALFTAPFTDGIDRETGQGDVFPDFTFGAQAVEVAVDIETGEVTVLKSAAAHDVGRAINPAAVVGQIQGGAEQGMGYALMEDFVVQEGVTRTPSFSEYLIPTAKDFPDTEAIVLESGTGVGPFGAKGIGEPALTPAAPAIANAVADAIGVRIHELPITPERVLKALERLEE